MKIWCVEMNILFLTNGTIGQQMIARFRDEGYLVDVHTQALEIGYFENRSYDYLISYNYSHIIKSELLNLFPHSALNLHISYLPWNKGADPNIWSFLDDTPKGVSIHYIDKGLDTGDILGQRELFFDNEKETLESTYTLLH